MKKKLLIISIIAFALIAISVFIITLSDGKYMVELKDKMKFGQQTVQLFEEPKLDSKDTDSSIISSIPKEWIFNIIKQDEFLNASIIQIDENTLEISFQEKKITPLNYEWHFAVCDVGEDIQTRTKENEIWSEPTTLTKQEFSKTSMPKEWCKDYGNEGYAIKSEATKLEITNKFRIIIPSDVDFFRLYAGNGSVLIDGSANELAVYPNSVDSFVLDKNGTLHVAYEGGDSDLWYAQSFDKGLNWNARELLADTVEDVGLFLNSTEDMRITWIKFGDIQTITTIDGGSTWSAVSTMINPGSGANQVAYYSCTLDSGDNLHCVYWIQDNLKYENSTVGFDNPHTLRTRGGGGVMYPDLEADENDDIYVVGVDSSSTDLWSWSTLTGMTVAGATQVEGALGLVDTAGRGWHPSITTYNNGTNNYVIIAAIQASDLQVYISTNATYPTFIGTEVDGSDSFAPTVNVDQNGTLHILYQDTNQVTSSTELYYSNSTYPWTTWTVRTQLESTDAGHAAVTQSTHPLDRNNLTSELYYVFAEDDSEFRFNKFDIPAPVVPAPPAETTAPRFFNLTEDPTDPATYLSTQLYQFNATWFDDDSQIDTVVITFNGTNYTDRIFNLSTVYSFNLTSLAVATYNYTWHANDTVGNSNTTGELGYTVNRANSRTNLTLNGTFANFTMNVSELANLTATRLLGEATIQILLDGVQIGTEGSFTNTTNFTEVGVFNITSFHPTSENYTLNFTMFNIIVVDIFNPNVTLLAPPDNNITITGDILFNSSANDNYELLNASLYHNITGTWHLNQSIDVTGKNNFSDFTISDLNNTEFIWNMLYCDNSSNCAFAFSNRTINVSRPIGVDTTPPQYFNLTETPSDPATYSTDQLYQFNSTWTENGVVDTVIITFNETNITIITSVDNIYSFNISDLATATYNYTWHANDTKSNSNTTGELGYTINRDTGASNLTLNGTSANLTINVDELVNMTVKSISLQGALELYLEGTQLNTDGDGGISLSNTTNFTAIGVFNVTGLIPLSENYTANFSTFYVITQDNTPPNVTLLDPPDNNITETGDILFNSTGRDTRQLLNATLYHNITGTWHANQTVNVSGTINLSDFTISDLNNTEFIWNVQYCDNSSNCAFAFANRTINVSIPFTPPVISGFVFSAINSSLDIMGSTSAIFNISNLQEIEFVNVSFFMEDTGEGILQDPIIYYTANGTNGCALGNNQSSTCFSYPSFIEFRNDTETSTFNDIGGRAQGDSIQCTYEGNLTQRNYTCEIDEHYNPNVFKHYPLNFSDIKYQTTTAVRLNKNKLWRINISSTLIPTDAEVYKLDLRTQAVGNPTQPLLAFLCNTTYTTGDPSISDFCTLVASKLPADLQDDGEKFRALFQMNLTEDLGDIGFIVLDTDIVSNGKYYAMKTYGFLGSDPIIAAISTDGGSSYSALADGYETEANINFFYTRGDNEATQTIFKVFGNDTGGDGQNSSEFSFTWLTDIINQAPIVDIFSPVITENITTPTFEVNWTTVDPNGDNFTTNVSANNGTVTQSIAVNLNRTTFSTIWDTTTFVNGFWNLTVISCEVQTPEMFCGNDTHEVNISLPKADTTAPSFFNLTEEPSDPSNYDTTQLYRFNSTWVDDFQVATVIITFNGTNYTDRVFNLSTIYSFNRTGLAAATYNYSWHANDTLGNSNTTGELGYTINRASSEVNLTLNGTSANFTLNVSNVANLTSFRVFGEATILILLDGIQLGTEGSVTNTTNFTEVGVFNVTGFHPISENYTSNFSMFNIIVVDIFPPNVTLLDPPDNNITETGDINFNSSANDNYELLNASLYHNITGTWHLNQSVNVSNKNNITDFTISDLNNTEFIWNVEYCDNNSNCNFAFANRTINVSRPLALDTTPPLFSDLTEDPTDPATYLSTQFYQFNSTWTDNAAIGTVIITFNETNTTIITSVGSIYSFNITGLAAATYNYTWHANDTSGNSNTTGELGYTINRAEGGTDLTLNGNGANITIGFNDTANMTAERIFGEVGMELLLQEVLLAFDGTNITTITNSTNFTALGGFNVTSFIRQSENYTANFTTFHVNVIDNDAPNVTLITPPDNNITFTGDINFNTSATDDIQLSNATLYHNISGTFTQNISVDLAGTFNLTNFSIDNIDRTVFIWNVLWCDNSSNCAFAANNFTVNVTSPDLVAPIVTLVDPADNNISDTGNITFDFSATNSELKNGTLYHNISSSFGANETIDLTGLSDTGTFNVSSVGNGTYIWNVLACDVSHNCAFAANNFTFNVSLVTVPEKEVINITNLTLYGEMFFHDESGVTVPIDSLGQWFNITGFEEGELNGVTFNGNETLTVLQEGIYKVEYSLGFTGGANHEYQFIIAANGEVMNRTETHRKTAGNDFGSAGGNGLLNLTANSQLQLMVMDETNPPMDVTIKVVDINVHRLNPDISNLADADWWELATILAVFLTVGALLYNFTLLEGIRGRREEEEIENEYQ